ncbi:hypothetical protein DB346_09340 [Verrucomicrobia bacterium LW23]|nr:hypothetical protein DB346_09340 [Verrucomicrobia bacterium LW23]
MRRLLDTIKRPQTPHQQVSVIVQDYFINGSNRDTLGREFNLLHDPKEYDLLPPGGSITRERTAHNKPLGISAQTKASKTVQSGKNSAKFTLVVAENMQGNLTDLVRLGGRTALGGQVLAGLTGTALDFSGLVPKFWFNVSGEGASSRTVEVTVPEEYLKEEGFNLARELGDPRPGIKFSVITTKGFKAEISARANSFHPALEIIDINSVFGQGKAFFKSLAGVSPNFKVALSRTGGEIETSTGDRSVFTEEKLEVAGVMTDGVDGVLMERGFKGSRAIRVDTAVVSDDEMGDRVTAKGSKKTYTSEGPLPFVRQQLRSLISGSTDEGERAGLERMLQTVEEQAKAPNRVLTALFPEAPRMLGALMNMRDSTRDPKLLEGIDALAIELREPVDPTRGSYLGEGDFSAEMAAYFLDKLKDRLATEPDSDVRASLIALRDQLEGARSTFSVQYTMSLTEEGAERVNQAKLSGNMELMRQELISSSNYKPASIALSRVSEPEEPRSQMRLRGDLGEEIPEIVTDKSKLKVPIETILLT